MNSPMNDEWERMTLDAAVDFAVICSGNGLALIRQNMKTFMKINAFENLITKWWAFYIGLYVLTHWGQVTHRCFGNLTIIGSDNGLSPGRYQAIIWTNAGILLIGSLGTNFGEIFTEIITFSFKKMYLKVSPAKWRPFCLGLNVLIDGSGANPLQSVRRCQCLRRLCLPGLCHHQARPLLDYVKPAWLVCIMWHDQLVALERSLIAKFMGPTWGPSGADRTQVGPMLAPGTLLSEMHQKNGYTETTGCQCAKCIISVALWVRMMVI